MSSILAESPAARHLLRSETRARMAKADLRKAETDTWRGQIGGAIQRGNLTARLVAEGICSRSSEIMHPARAANTPMRRLLSDGPERIAIMLALLLILAAPVSAQTKPAWPTQLALGSYLVLGSIDIAQTSACVARGTCVEANPVMRPVVQGHGIATAAAAKTAVSVGIVYGLLKARHSHPKVAWWTAVGLAAAQTVIVVRNARVS